MPCCFFSLKFLFLFFKTFWLNFQFFFFHAQRQEWKTCQIYRGFRPSSSSFNKFLRVGVMWGQNKNELKSQKISLKKKERSIYFFVK